MPKVQTRRTKRFVKRVFGSVGKYVSGEIPDTHGIGGFYWTTMVRFLFEKLHESYIVRSLGGTDELGNSFAPLKKETIARRPIGKKQLGGLGLTKKQTGVSISDRERGLLSPLQNKLWKAIYSKVLSMMILKTDEKTAKMISAKVAWAHLKKKGAATRSEKLGNRDVLIMRVTDRIVDSLRPSKAGVKSYRPVKDQIYEREGNKAELGTSVPYARFHNKTRPVIPDDINEWIEQGSKLAMDETIKYIVENVL